MRRYIRRFGRVVLEPPQPSLGIEFMKLGFTGFGLLLGTGLLVGVFTNFVALVVVGHCRGAHRSDLRPAVETATFPEPPTAARRQNRHHRRQRRAARVRAADGMLLQDAIGDPFTRKYGVAETISVQATKHQSDHRRSRCNLRLQGAGLGNRLCLSREEFDSLPRKVRVDLVIRRSVLGYHVDSQQIAPTETE